MISPTVITRATVLGKEREFALTNKVLYDLQDRYGNGENIAQFVDRICNGSSINLTIKVIVEACLDKSLSVNHLENENGFKSALELVKLVNDILVKSLGLGESADPPLPETPAQTGS